MNTHETYVSLETAKLLKQVGFDWEVDTSYVRDYGDMDDDAEYIPLDTFWFGEMGTKNWNREELSTVQYGKHQGLLTRASAPSLTVAQKWLREVKGIEVNVLCVYIKHIKKYSYDVFTNEYEHELINEGFDTYEEALEAGIQTCLSDSRASN